MIDIKILSYKSPQRFAVRRTLMAVQNELRKTYPELKIDISEVKELVEMEKYTAVVILPSLVVNEKLVCVGRFPSKQEVRIWLKNAMEE
ncbi:MAG: hypothetical protein A2Y88_14115 [Chloroflexi bacterium RBG_13_48_10]|nr:MAG: hypothetical protein A2Y88_14115 [Chloroflexi bacterium RBG_13_48_10]